MAVAKKSKSKAKAKRVLKRPVKLVKKSTKKNNKKSVQKSAKKVTTKLARRLVKAEKAVKAVATKTLKVLKPKKVLKIKKISGSVKKVTPKKNSVKKVTLKSPKPQSVKKSPAPLANQSAVQPEKKALPLEAATTNLAVGDVAPHFDMPATVLGRVSTTSLAGKPYVLYFYPKDDTPGCTTEACGFRDALPSLELLNITVIGVSKDNLSSHAHFAEKFHLTFPLAFDDGSVCENFGVWVSKSMYGRSYMGIERTTFLIDAEGVIRAIWHKVNVAGHVDEVQKEIKNL